MSELFKNLSEQEKQEITNTVDSYEPKARSYDEYVFKFDSIFETRDGSKMMILQGSDRWLELRHKHFNASTVSRIMYKETTYKTGDKKGQARIEGIEPFNAMCYVKAQGQELDLLPESQQFANADFGHLNETKAIDYILKVNNLDRNDFIINLFDIDDETKLMASPDMMHRSGKYGFEIKCPKYDSGNHMRVINNVKDGESLKEYNKDYYWQVMANMYVFGAKHWYFCSYAEYMNDAFKLHVVRIDRNEEDISTLVDRLISAKNTVKSFYSVTTNSLIY